jgi:hypothetical protein
MKKSTIVIIGNCQGSGIASALRILIPDFNIKSFNVSELGDTAKIDNIKESLLNAQYIIGLDNYKESYFDFCKNQNVIFYKLPFFTFSAFHPDQATLVNNGEILRLSSGNTYQSLIIFYCYLNGVKIEDVSNFFADHYFTKLGYYDLWNREVLRQTNELSSYGIKNDNFFRGLGRKGNFMHTYNHPKIIVLCEIAKLFAEKILGMRVNYPSNIFESVVDQLSFTGIWPVYPEIASRYGLEGSYIWRLGDTPIVGLNKFIEYSYSEYEKLDKEYMIKFSKSFNTAVYDAALT